MVDSRRFEYHGITSSEFIPRAKLVSFTNNAIGTIFEVWHGSRYTKSVEADEIAELYWNAGNEFIEASHKDLIKDLCEWYPDYAGINGDDYKNIIEQVVKLAIKTDVPASEFVSYEFKVDTAPVAWREQLVRKRKLHVWTQTTRNADMSKMDVTILPTVEMAGDEAVTIYKNAVDTIRDAYTALIELGVPSEDIRLQPQTHVHRVYFGANLRDLLKLVQDRTSWLIQPTLWAPIVADIVEVLEKTLGGWVRDILARPVTLETGIDGHPKIVDYKYISDEEDRYTGRDKVLPVSPLYLAFTGKSMPEHTDIKFYDYMKSLFIKIWDDDTLDAIDWDKNNPTKLGRYDRPDNYEE